MNSDRLAEQALREHEQSIIGKERYRISKAIEGKLMPDARGDTVSGAKLDPKAYEVISEIIWGKR